jgi:hypothetical protein
MKEISRDEYWHLKELLVKAEKNLQKYHSLRGRPWVNEYHYFFSNSSKPCIYNNSSAVPCLFSGEPIKKFKRAGKNFNYRYNFNAFHFSPKGCPNLSTRDSVLCIGQKDGKYYVGKHKVGKCPLRPTDLSELKETYDNANN